MEQRTGKCLQISDRKEPKTKRRPGPAPLGPLTAGGGLAPFPDVLFSFYTEKSETENVEENEEPFIAPVGLNVPPDVELVCVSALRSCDHHGVSPPVWEPRAHHTCFTGIRCLTVS